MHAQSPKQIDTSKYQQLPLRFLQEYEHGKGTRQKYPAKNGRPVERAEAETGHISVSGTQIVCPKQAAKGSSYSYPSWSY